MAKNIKIKFENFLSEKEELESEYEKLLSKCTDSDEDLKDLHEFDQLIHTFTAINTYYKCSKSHWESDYRNLLDELQSLHDKTISRFPIAELNKRFPGLAVLRRRLRENAQEGGGLAGKLVLSSYDLEKLTSLARPQTQAAVHEVSESQQQPKPPSSNTPSSNLQKSPISLLLNTMTKDMSKQPGSNTQGSSSQNQMGVLGEKPALSKEMSTKNAQETRHSQNSASVLQKNNPDEISTQLENHLAENSASTTTANRYKATGNSLDETFNRDKIADVNPSYLKPSPKAKPSEQKKSNLRQPMRIDDGSFSQFSTWTREHCRCIMEAALHDTKNPVLAIQRAISEKFGIMIHQVGARTLYRHYGLEPSHKNHFMSYNAMFKSIANSFLSSKSYVTVPWQDLRYAFRRKSGHDIQDWEIKGRYYLHILHCKIYGARGEPFSNFSDLTRYYHEQLEEREKRDQLMKESPATSHQSLQFQARNENLSSQIFSSFPPDLSPLLVEATKQVPPDTPQKLPSIATFIEHRSEKRVASNAIEEEIRKMETHQHYGASEHYLSQPHIPQEQSPQVSGNGQWDIIEELRNAIIENEKPEWFYKAYLTASCLDDLWTFERSKCILSTIAFAAKCEYGSSGKFRLVGDLVLRVILHRLKSEHQTLVSEADLRERLRKMRELKLFNFQEERLLGEHKL